MGRPTLFSPQKHRVNGYLTDDAHRLFERVRKLLGRKSGYARVSDGNVVEALVLGADIDQCLDHAKVMDALADAQK
jgi:hypothetical protein